MTSQIGYLLRRHQKADLTIPDMPPPVNSFGRTPQHPSTMIVTSYISLLIGLLIPDVPSLGPRTREARRGRRRSDLKSPTGQGPRSSQASTLGAARTRKMSNKPGLQTRAEVHEYIAMMRLRNRHLVLVGGALTFGRALSTKSLSCSINAIVRALTLSSKLFLLYLIQSFIVITSN